MESLVKLDSIKKESAEARTKCLKLANAEYLFFLDFTDAMFTSDSFSPYVDGKWTNADGEVVSAKCESTTNNLELIWVESTKEKFKYSGQTNGRSSKGRIEKWKEPSLGLSLLSFGSKEEGKFESHGDGLVFLSKDMGTIRVFIQESGSSNYRSISFLRAKG